MRSRFLARSGVFLALAVFLFTWHAPLLSPEGRVRGFGSDAAIIALMGKKMFDGRGFDIFFWGQNYVGPLTSMFIAGAGFFTRGVDPLALRVGTFCEVLTGILLMGWGISRIDARAAVLTVVALAITPPVLLSMMINPLGAEMGFLCSAALFAVMAQHLTAAPGSGWLSRGAGQVAFGALVGISWWMNQQVVFTLMAGALVFAFRSRIATPVLREIRIGDRLMLRGEALGWRRIPGVVEALAWVMIRAGFLLLAAYVILDVAGKRGLPFVFGRATDALLLILSPLLVLPLVFSEWRRWRFHADRAELAAALRVATGFALGYAPVWLGRILGWYTPSYVFHFSVSTPAGAVNSAATLLSGVVPPWIGMSPGPLGMVFGATLALLAVAGALRANTQARVLLVLIPMANFIFFVVARGAQVHYFITSTGMLYGVAALGGVALWDSRKRLVRVALAVAAVMAFASIGIASSNMRRETLSQPDPRPLLARVHAERCAVSYADFRIAYRYRFLDGERGAWIPYASENRTRAESFAFQRRSGQRCLVGNDGSVTPIPHDLPMVHKPPRG
jgi:hypothetical protein